MKKILITFKVKNAKLKQRKFNKSRFNYSKAPFYVHQALELWKTALATIAVAVVVEGSLKSHFIELVLSIITA